MFIEGSCEARVLNAASEVFTPGIIIPPRNTLPELMTPTVVAVPISKTMAGEP